MSHELLDELLDNSYSGIDSLFLYGTGLMSALLLKSRLGFLGAALTGLGTGIINSFLRKKISKAIWGDKTAGLKITIQDDTDINAQLVKRGRSKASYPVKTTLTELENEIRAQLKKLIKPSDLLGAEGVAVTDRSIEAYTHRIAKSTITSYPKLFYLADRKKVEMPAYQIEIDNLMNVTASKPKRKME